jgi:DNA-binding PadR family transcriptional regulator
MAARTHRPLTATECVVLGMLATHELSGYDLHQRMDTLNFWTPARTQVYAVLATLLERGLTSVRRVRQTARPDKDLFRITAAGELALRQALDEGISPRWVIKDPVLLHVFLGNHLELDRLATLIESRRRQAEQRLDALEDLARRLPDPEHGDFFTLLTLRASIERVHGTLRWAREAQQLVEKRRTEQPSDHVAAERPF